MLGGGVAGWSSVNVGWAGVGLSCVGHFHDLRTSVRELSAMGFVVYLMSEQCECWVLLFV